MTGGDGAGGAVEPALERGAAALRGEDDGEDAVGALAEVAGENRAGPLRVGSGHRERRREERRQPGVAPIAPTTTTTSQ